MSEISTKQKIINLLTSNGSEKQKSYIDYTPSFKTHYVKLKQESNKKVISFSVYGDKTVYLVGAEQNIEVASKIYPDWVCRFYCDKDISNLDKLKRLAEEGKCELVVVDSPIFQMYWRYFAADDPNVSSVIFRDTDSLVNFREKAAVNEWILSDKSMHTMHDNDAGHWSPVMGGMCGLKLPLPINMHSEIDSWAKSLRGYGFAYSDDQSFLSKKILPLFENSLIDHHNNPSKSKFKNSVPFPDHEDIGYGNFVGDRISAFGFKKRDLMSIDSVNVLLACHLGPTDHYSMRDAIQAVINNYEEVVIPIKKHSELLVNYMFGGYDKVKIEIVNSDEGAFNLYQSKYKNHKLIGFGMHGEHIPEMKWGLEQSFRQANLAYTPGIFSIRSNPKYNYSTLSENYKKNLQEKNTNKHNPLLTSTASLKVKNLNEDSKVTVIIPSYHRFKYLLKSLDSLKKQTYKNFEVIILNDGSPSPEYHNYDFKSNYGENFHILHLPKNSRSIHGKVAGGGHARNIGMMLSDAKYIAFLDDDDQFLPNKLEVQVKNLQNSDCKISCTEALVGSGPMDPEKSYKNWHYNGIYWNSIKNIFAKSNKEANFNRMFNGGVNIWTNEDILTHNCCVCSTVMIDRSIVDQAGYFPLKPFAEDWAYWKQILKHTNCLYIREPLSYMDSSHGDGQYWIQ